jgi:hypothetical protein
MTDSSAESGEKSMEDKKTFIFDNINELSLQDRITMVQLIYNSSDRSKLKEKGNGVQIKLDTVSPSVLDNLYKTLNVKIEEQTLNLE